MLVDFDIASTGDVRSLVEHYRQADHIQWYDAVCQHRVQNSISNFVANCFDGILTRKIYNTLKPYLQLHDLGFRYTIDNLPHLQLEQAKLLELAKKLKLLYFYSRNSVVNSTIKLHNAKQYMPQFSHDNFIRALEKAKNVEVEAI